MSKPGASHLESSTVIAARTAGQQPMSSPIALLFRFPFPGPWGEALTEHARGLASDIAAEPGLKWKIWLEDRKGGQAGGIYLFEDAVSAERYRAKHERRLAAMGLAGVATHAFSVNAELSVLTRASLPD